MPGYVAQFVQEAKHNHPEKVNNTNNCGRPKEIN